jgi:hypothetical protein
MAIWTKTTDKLKAHEQDVHLALCRRSYQNLERSWPHLFTVMQEKIRHGCTPMQLKDWAKATIPDEPKTWVQFANAAEWEVHLQRGE